MNKNENFSTSQFKEDCYGNATDIEHGWYRKICTDPVWKELNAACPVFQWQENEWPYTTRGCSGIRSSQHFVTLDPDEYPSDSVECDGKYHCADRSDEATCVKVAAPNVEYGFEHSDFDCK